MPPVPSRRYAPAVVAERAPEDQGCQCHEEEALGEAELEVLGEAELEVLVEAEGEAEAEAEAEVEADGEGDEVTGPGKLFWRTGSASRNERISVRARREQLSNAITTCSRAMPGRK